MKYDVRWSSRDAVLHEMLVDNVSPHDLSLVFLPRPLHDDSHINTLFLVPLMSEALLASMIYTDF